VASGTRMSGGVRGHRRWQKNWPENTLTVAGAGWCAGERKERENGFLV